MKCGRLQPPDSEIITTRTKAAARAGGQAAQCQGKGLCWCVDSRGQELPGTRRRGASILWWVSSASSCSCQVMLLCIIYSRLTFPEHIHSIASHRGAPQTLQVQQDGNRLSLLISIMFSHPVSDMLASSGSSENSRRGEEIKLCGAVREVCADSSRNYKGNRGQFYHNACITERHPGGFMAEGDMMSFF